MVNYLINSRNMIKKLIIIKKNLPSLINLLLIKFRIYRDSPKLQEKKYPSYNKLCT
jgi:hypothetical protein